MIGSLFDKHQRYFNVKWIQRNITTLSSIIELSLNDYKDKILKHFLYIINNTPNVINKRYVIGCIIYAFNYK